MSKKNEFWYFLIHGTLDKQTGVYGNFYTYGTHCGNALKKTLLIAEQEGIINPDLIETCRLDNIEDFELPKNTIEINPDVFMIQTFNTYDLRKKEYSFTPPIGIAFSTDEGEFDQDLIKECFVAYGKNENDILEFELVVDKSRLIETFYKTIEFLPNVDRFWLYLKEHWDNTKTELWAGKEISDKNSVMDFLTKNEETTLKNGFIDIVVHSKKGETNLTLNEHKKIQLHTKDETVFQNFIEKVIDLGFEQTRDYYNIEYGYYHWHYRTDESLNKIEFQQLLVNKGFEYIKINE
ncbi:hypothetical protein LA303_07885 [Candidatus Sulfidibacterium hydrothermale]|uniref:hypothetical protein n=1 Tax=Candidatus Sulfidibacterium hydrothermale TaxID=2875962 RepID=UPI001F0A4A47|nr:hypothetical protein [Candidatus Sulfidibacterium hydrothermale]UBM61343.1 hypothetical protein LA303_07885 [Candidatus Sulfidibacterium hydrothermale]